MSTVKYFNETGELLQGFTQWSSNMKIAISGADISPVPYFQFCNCFSETATSIQAQVSGEQLIVEVPNNLLTYAYPIDIYLYYKYEDGSAKVKYDLHIPVSSNKKPQDYGCTSVLGFGILDVTILGED